MMTSDDDNAAFYGLLADNKYCAYKVYVYKSYQKLYTYSSGSSDEGKWIRQRWTCRVQVTSQKSCFTGISLIFSEMFNIVFVFRALLFYLFTIWDLLF